MSDDTEEKQTDLTITVTPDQVEAAITRSVKGWTLTGTIRQRLARSKPEPGVSVTKTWTKWKWW